MVPDHAGPSTVRRIQASVDHGLDRLVPAALVLSGGVVALCVAARILLAPQSDWNAARLWFSAALARGFDIYPVEGSDPTLGYIYGPVSALAYLPAAVFGSPTVAVLVGASIAVALAVGPASALLLSSAPTGHYRWVAVVALAAFCLVLEPLRHSAFAIHADAPSLALTTGAVWLWHRAVCRRGTYLPAAALVALALWCRQNMAPVALALPLWSLIVAGPRESVRGIASLAVAGAVVSAMAVAAFGFGDLVFNLVTLPGATPWYGSGTRLQRLAPVLRDYAALMAPWFLGFVTLATLHWLASRPTKPPFNEWLRRSPWMLLGLTSLLLAPTSILAKARMGGNLNSWTPTLYFLVLACLCAALDLCRTPDRRARPSGASRFARALLLGSMIALGLYEGLGPDLRDWRRDETRHPFSNPQQQAHDFLRANPGSTYFPWNPLAHLLAESRLVHHADGVIIRDLAGRPLSQAEFDAGVGRWFVFVASAPGRRNERVQSRYLPSFSERVDLPGLPGWTVYRVPASSVPLPP